MSMRTKYLLPLLLAAALSGCRKPEPIVESETPVFSVHGSLGNASIDLEAGVNGYYMHSSYASEQQMIYAYSGELKQEGCGWPCPSGLRVKVYDYRSYMTMPTNIDSALYVGYFNFASADSLTANFTPQLLGDSALSYLWDFGDGNQSSLAAPSHTYAAPGIYNVCLTVDFFNNNQACSSSICNTVPIGMLPACGAVFTSASLPGDSVLFNSLALGTPPYSYSWNFGDSSMGSGPNPGHQYFGPGADSGIYHVSLTMNDANFCTSTFNRNIAINSATGCMANFDWQTATNPFSVVVIEWTDAGGAVWSTLGGPQGSSTFEVLSVEEYDRNENGLRTKKVHMRVNCSLYNGVNSMPLTNADIVFAFAYP